jgi:hypothetical protein
MFEGRENMYNEGFIAELANRDYDARICPWTGAACP